MNFEQTINQLLAADVKVTFEALTWDATHRGVVCTIEGQVQAIVGIDFPAADALAAALEKAKRQGMVF